jgi:voltage-gated potassium channel
VLVAGRVAGQGMWLFRIGIALRRGARGISRFWQRSRLDLVMALTGVVVVIGATLMLLLERGHPQGRIQDFGDALWWSAAVVTTVASDLNPVTPGGRLLAVFMMVYGMTVFGYLVSQAVNVIQKPDPPGAEPDSR